VAKPVVVERTLACRSDVKRLWDAVTDTGYLNRLSGLQPFALSEVKDATGVRFRVKTRAGGFSVTWQEQPFEWQYLKRFRVRRLMEAGPVREIDTSFAFAPDELGGTTLTVRLALEPKYGLARPLIKLGARRSALELERAVLRVDEALAAQAALPGAPADVLRSALERVRQALRVACDPALADRLCDFVRDEREERVGRMRPYELADAWGLPRAQVLAACLTGVRAGLLELRWALVCPSCRGPTEMVPTLAQVGEHGACHLCEIEFGLEADEAVEATFRPCPAVRRVDLGRYCVGGPALVPHVLAQALLPPGGEAELGAPDEPGRYRLFVRGGAACLVEVAEGAPAEVRVESVAGEALRVAPGGVVRVRGGDDERHVKIERTQWKLAAATARDVTAMPGFRRDFSAEVLRPDVSLKVSRVAVLFTDLTGSTQLYSTVGDAPALKLVQDHFDLVVGIVERHGGTLVKTIGDAVMAAFTDELHALAAGLEIIGAFDGFRRAQALGDKVDIKVGLYGGPSYLITANNVLDYFGQTVNIAARIQSQANSGELVIDAGLADDPAARPLLAGAVLGERFSATLKGVDQPLTLVRVRRR
jgi:class 3 adenylate cyclase